MVYPNQVTLLKQLSEQLESINKKFNKLKINKTALPSSDLMIAMTRWLINTIGIPMYSL